MSTNLERDLWELARLIERIGAYRSDILAEQYNEIATQRDRLAAIAQNANTMEAA